jgi:osmotically-inducible protein OsmY
MKPVHALLVVSIVFLLAACDDGKDVTRSVEQAVAKELLTPVDPDRQLADKVEKALGTDNGAVPYGIEVTVTSGRVELWGTVDSNALRKRIEITTAGVVGVKAIESHLQVDPGA